MRHYARLIVSCVLLTVAICSAQTRLIPHQVKSVINIGREGTFGSSNVRGLVLSYPYVYCAGEPGLAVVYVSDPGNPVLVCERDTLCKANEPSFGLGHLFLANWHIPLRVYSLADPAAPVHVFNNHRSDEHFHGWGASVYGNRLYMSEATDDQHARVWAYNISTPSAPVELAHLAFSNRHIGTPLRAGNVLYYTARTRLAYADVSNDNAITPIGSKDLNSLGGTIAKDGDYLYVVSGVLSGYPDGGLRVFSLANPRDPVQVAYWDQNMNGRDIHIQSGMAFVPAGGNEMFTLDITDPANPYTIAHTPIEDFPITVDGEGKYVYVGSAEDRRRPEKHWGAKLTVVQVLEDEPTPTRTPTATPTPTPTIMKGDMEPDGDRDLFDVLRLVDIILGWPPAPSAHERLAGDVDDDGDIDLFDVLALVDIVLGRI